MNEARTCRGCEAEIPTNAPLGHCPKCLLALGFDLPNSAETTPSQNTSSGVERSFGDYELLEQIGRGGMGVVYKARQIALNRFVAIKMVSAGEFASSTLIERFHREAEAAANLHHPNVVPIYETGEHQGVHFFSMQLIEGVGLDRHIGRKGFDFGGMEQPSLRERQEKIARILNKVALAVDHAHQHGVLHRDLKPSNIILDRDEEPHLTDFGVAKVIGHGASSLTASGAVMGTPSYMAPEQAAGQGKRISTAADVYSLGAILYAMLTGHPPFRGNTAVETLRLVVEQEPKHPSTFDDGVDRDLATVAMKCLEKEPGRRYCSARAMAEDLDRWLRREPIHARPSGPIGRLQRWCLREPALAFAAGAICACLLAITAVSLLAYKKEQEKRIALANAQGQLIRDQLDDLDEFWTNSTDTSVLIRSERLASRTGRIPKEEGPRIVFGAYTHTKPSDMFTRFAPVLSFLETNASALSLRIDFVIYRSYSNAVEALANGQVGFMRPGPGSYVSARQRAPGLQVLAKQLHDGLPFIHGVIFIRTNSGIARFADLQGQAIAAADEESTFGNYVPKAFLFDQGLRRRSLTAWSFVGSHDETVKKVADGSFPVGSANSNVVGRFMKSHGELRILHPMQSISFPWVASANLDADVAKALKASLLSLKDAAILQTMDRNLGGFTEAQASDYDDFEQNIMTKARAFDE